MSTREQVAALYREGKTCGQIARELGKNSSTISYHLSRLAERGLALREPAGVRPSTISLSPDQRAQLEDRAREAGLSVSAYVRRELGLK